MDINLPVTWRIINTDWSNGDRTVLRLSHGDEELYTHIYRALTVRTSVFYPHRASREAEGEYQITIEYWHNEHLVTSATRGFVWYYEPMAHCLSEYPLQITHVSHRGETGYVPGGVMHISFCAISPNHTSPPPQFVRIVFRQPSTGQEWVVGERISTSTSGIDWEIPADVPPGSGYELEIFDVGGSNHFTYTFRITIREP